MKKKGTNAWILRIFDVFSLDSEPWSGTRIFAKDARSQGITIQGVKQGRYLGLYAYHLVSAQDLSRHLPVLLGLRNTKRP